jgi:uncharacterized secreted protein with C-terminal beta-propeller domain
MTNVIIIGEQPAKKELKPIEFKLKLDSNHGFTSNFGSPKQWENIELICKNYSTQYDLMFAFDYNRQHGILYLGHFNDGIV